MYHIPKYFHAILPPQNNKPTLVFSLLLSSSCSLQTPADLMICLVCFLSPQPESNHEDVNFVYLTDVLKLLVVWHKVGTL